MMSFRSSSCDFDNILSKLNVSFKYSIINCEYISLDICLSKTVSVSMIVDLLFNCVKFEFNIYIDYELNDIHHYFIQKLYNRSTTA